MSAITSIAFSENGGWVYVVVVGIKLLTFAIPEDGNYTKLFQYMKALKQLQLCHLVCWI